jgi:ABC-type glycerol-3-phosphate transport system permease component
MMQQRLGRTAQYGTLIIVLLLLAFPIYYMVITSLKPPGEAYRLPPTLWPRNPTIDAYPFVVKA